MFKKPSAAGNTSIRISRQKLVIGMKLVREKVVLFIHNLMACTHGKSNFCDRCLNDVDGLYSMRSSTSVMSSLVYNVGRPAPFLWWTLPVSRNSQCF